MDLTKELPFKVGDEIKNYKEMCKLLGEKVRTGGARENQLKRWSDYFSWEKNGHKFIIKEIFNNLFPSTDDNLSGSILFKTCHIHERQRHDLGFQSRYVKIQKNFSCTLNQETHTYMRIIYLLLGEELFLNPYSLREMKQALRDRNNYFKYNNKDVRDYVLTVLIPKRVHVVSNILHHTSYTLRDNAIFIENKEGNFIYKFMGKNKQVIYVGRSENINQRLQNHFNNGHLPQSLYHQTENIYILKTESASEMALLELYYINKYKPKYNIRDKFDSPFYYVRQFELKHWEKLPKEVVQELKTLIPSE